jgi:hypothetical protein
MTVKFIYFHEKTNSDYETHNLYWHEHRDRFIFLQIHLTLIQQLDLIKDSIDETKDILAVRFPDYDELNRNKIIKNITLGKGIPYDTDKVWYPKEVWIYCLSS